MCLNRMDAADSGFILLAGGSSRRMGRDKCGLMWEGRTFLESQLARGERLGFGQVMVSGGPAGGPAAEAVPDVLPGAGPMGGIYSCLAAARYSKNLVLPVDVPQFPDRWALRLLHLARESGADVTVLSLQGRQEPLLSVWDAGCCPVLRSLLERGERKVSSAFALLRVAELDYAEEPFWIGNINTPEDYEKFLGGKAAPGIGGEEAGAFEETEQIS